MYSSLQLFHRHFHLSIPSYFFDGVLQKLDFLIENKVLKNVVKMSQQGS